MDWDLEVDVVCTGAGAAGLATAISVGVLGGEVFIADCSAGAPVPAGGDGMHPWLGTGVGDTETDAYLASLSSDLGPFRRSVRDIAVPISVVHQPPLASGRNVAPFVGSRLRDWAARCLASSYGYLYTRVANWHTTTLHTADGELIEVAEIGSITPDPFDVGGSVLDWLTAEAHDRNVAIEPDCALQRIVFEDGYAVGAVFTTSDGTLAIRARNGVTVVAPSSPNVRATAPRQPFTDDATMRVCLVTRYASRFGRVELLTSNPLARCAPSTCGPANRALHVNMHETQAHSVASRCGKVHGYPPIGQ